MNAYGVVHVCPPNHSHGSRSTCYVSHGCRCEPCRAASSDRYRARRGESERVLAPCGTHAAIRRHWRRGEPVDDVCREGEVERRRGERKVERAARVEAVVGAPPEVRVEGGTVTIVASLEEARLIAAAVLDRALVLEPNRHTASSATPAITQSAQIVALRELHKRIAQAVRAVG